MELRQFGVVPENGEKYPVVRVLVFEKMSDKYGYFSRIKTDIFHCFIVETDIFHDKMTADEKRMKHPSHLFLGREARHRNITG